MSVDTADLDPSTLLAKKRDELVVIAQAMGGEPPAKAQKSALVEMILELAGGRPAADSDQADRSDSEDGSGDGGGTGEKGAPAKDEAGDSGGAAKGGKGDKGGKDDSAQGSGRTELEPGNRRRRRRGKNRGDGQEEPWQGDPVPVEGTLDLRSEGYGFLRVDGFLASKEDVYVSVKQVRQFGLRRGDVLGGTSRPASRNEKNPALLSVDSVNGGKPEEARDRPAFDDLTPVFPNERLTLAGDDGGADLTARIVDLLAPVGKGQRGLIVSPPRAGRTRVLKELATAIEAAAPEVELIVLLVDERPEEVTDLSRALDGEVYASTFDRPSEEHTQIAELTLEKAKRMVEAGDDVVVVLDGITRLARAYNVAAPGTGRTLEGGVDSAALSPPKRLFGAARNLEDGGSLTILATAIVESGSRTDEVILEEFQGTANMQLRLDRRLADRRIHPAVDVDASSTRHEDQLLTEEELAQVTNLRRTLTDKAEQGEGAALELLITRLEDSATNEELLADTSQDPS